MTFDCGAMMTSEAIDTHWYLTRDMDAAEIVRTEAGEVAVYTHACPGRDGANEDAAAWLALPNGSFVLTVADGMGGLPDGRSASKLALRSLARPVTAAAMNNGQLRGAILDGIEAANRAIIAELAGSGSTLVVCEISGGVVRSYHVGDSAVMLVGQRGKLKQATIAHSPVGYAVEAGLLDAEAAMVHEDRHLISNMLGATDMKIEIGPKTTIAARDTLLLASDGVLDNLRPEEITELVRKGPLDVAAGELARACRERMLSPDAAHPSKPDDLTFVLFRLSH